MNIYIPYQFKNEIEYVLEVLFNGILLVKEPVQFHNEETDKIRITSQQGSLIINNIFFGKNHKGSYSVKNLPKGLSYLNHQSKIPFLYGDYTYREELNDIYVGGDIIGSVFFLLTQWESTLLEGDRYGRYDYKMSSINRLEIYTRPLVNEYAEFLRPLLHRIGVNTETRKYKPIFTCDVDSITKYSSIRNLLGGFRHRGLSYKVWEEYKRSKVNKGTDVFFSFPYLIRKLQEKCIDSTFYFMAAAEVKEVDTMDYDLGEPMIQSLIQQLKNNGYKIGLHPSINTWKDKLKMQAQKQKLEEAAKVNIVDVRQHYLRYDVNITLSQFDVLGFKTDSSIQFSEGMGFATGICNPYKLFDLSKRKPLEVTETPLVMMKKKDYVKDVESSFQSFKSLIDTCKKYNGEYAFLFHNSDLETENERILFEKVLNNI